ncbi:MAG TPA: FtsH protease activity modulator HflK [Gammaproteobacteria bacterium]|nr:FtsH protease activity modulator HflK [Gammaproteobacteria bacterium]
MTGHGEHEIMVWKEPGNDKDPWNTTQRPPDLERTLKNLQQRLGRLFGGKRGRPRQFHAAVLWWLVPAIIIAWLLSGFYRVAPGDRGVNFIFGRFENAVEPGLHWQVSWPVGRVLLVHGAAGSNYTHTYTRLLTSDGNVVVVDALVRYHVVNLSDFLFGSASLAAAPQEPGAGAKALLGELTDAAVRTAVARTTLAGILGSQRDAVESDARTRLSQALQAYASGIAVTQLDFQRVSLPEAAGSADADVQSARQDASQAQAAAHTYADNLLPQAQAAADARIKEAEAYRTTLVGEAQAVTAGFGAVLAAYRKAPALTREELYMSTMEDILANANKVIVDTRSGSVTVQLGQPFRPAPAATAVPGVPAKTPAASVTTATGPPAAGTGKEGA